MDIQRTHHAGTRMKNGLLESPAGRDHSIAPGNAMPGGVGKIKYGEGGQRVEIVFHLYFGTRSWGNTSVWVPLVWTDLFKLSRFFWPLTLPPDLGRLFVFLGARGPFWCLQLNGTASLLPGRVLADPCYCLTTPLPSPYLPPPHPSPSPLPSSPTSPPPPVTGRGVRTARTPYLGKK